MDAAFDMVLSLDVFKQVKSVELALREASGEAEYASLRG